MDTSNPIVEKKLKETILATLNNCCGCHLNDDLDRRVVMSKLFGAIEKVTNENTTPVVVPAEQAVEIQVKTNPQQIAEIMKLLKGW
jgi:ABC-type uncharacterized transport system auxiliary subunit